MIIVPNVLEFVENGVRVPLISAVGGIVQRVSLKTTEYVKGPKRISLKGVPSQGEMSISGEHVVD